MFDAVMITNKITDSLVYLFTGTLNFNEADCFSYLLKPTTYHEVGKTTMPQELTFQQFENSMPLVPLITSKINSFQFDVKPGFETEEFARTVLVAGQTIGGTPYSQQLTIRRLCPISFTVNYFSLVTAMTVELGQTIVVTIPGTECASKYEKELNRIRFLYPVDEQVSQRTLQVAQHIVSPALSCQPGFFCNKIEVTPKDLGMLVFTLEESPVSIRENQVIVGPLSIRVVCPEPSSSWIHFNQPKNQILANLIKSMTETYHVALPAFTVSVPKCLTLESFELVSPTVEGLMLNCSRQPCELVIPPSAQTQNSITFRLKAANK